MIDRLLISVFRAIRACQVYRILIRTFIYVYILHKNTRLMIVLHRYIIIHIHYLLFLYILLHHII